MNDDSGILFTIHYNLRIEDMVTTYSFLPDGSVIDISKNGDPIYPEYVLSDSVDLNSPRGTVLNMVVASDKDSNYNNFRKRIKETDGKGLEVVMPVFSPFLLISITEPSGKNE